MVDRPTVPRRAVPLVCATLVLCGLLLTVAAVARPTPPGELTVEDALSMDVAELLTIEIATGTPRPLVEAPAIATVITAEHIRAMGATDLYDVLEAVPGLHVSYDPLNYGPRLIMRGLYSASSPYVLVLVDGFPYNRYQSGSLGQRWGGLPVASIARIEVVRGPGSALFGADAVGGVVNIITKGAGDLDGTEVGVRAGSFDTQELWLLHGGREGGWSYGLSVELSTSDGPREIVRADAQTGLDELFGSDASLAPGPTSRGGDIVEARLDAKRGAWRFRGSFQGRYRLGSGVGATNALDPFGRSERRQWLVGVTWQEEIAPHWELEIESGVLDSRDFASLSSLPPGAISESGFFLPEGARVDFGFDETQWRIQAKATRDTGGSHRWRLGTGYRDIVLDNIIDRRNVDPFGMPIAGGLEDFSDDPNRVFASPEDRSTLFAFVQDEWRIAPGWDLTLGVRVDDYSDFGATVNPRLALIWQPAEAWTAKLLYGRAFRPPSHTEQYLINNAQLLGNPELDPEIINTLELAFVYEPRSEFRLGANLFAYELDDVILIRGERPSRYQNAGQRNGWGVELEAVWRPNERFELGGHLALQESRDEETGADVEHAPGEQLYLRAVRRWEGGWSAATILNAVAGRERLPDDPRPQIGDDTRLDLVLRREGLGKRFDLALIVHNALDEDLREPAEFVPGPARAYVRDDLPLAGRSVMLELRYAVP